MQTKSNVKSNVLPSKKTSNEIIDDLFSAIQNIIAGTINISNSALKDNILKCTLQLSANSPTIVLYYNLDKNYYERKIKVESEQCNQSLDEVHEDLVHSVKDNERETMKENVFPVAIKKESKIEGNAQKITLERRNYTEAISRDSIFKQQGNVNLTKANDHRINTSYIVSKSINTASTKKTNSTTFTELLSSSLDLQSKISNEGCKDSFFSEGRKKNSTTSVPCKKNNLIEIKKINTSLIAKAVQDKINTFEKVKDNKLQVKKINTTLIARALQERKCSFEKKPFLFRDCNKSFNQSMNYIHQRTYSSEQSLSFISVNPLQEHEQIHAEESIYICEYCGESFDMLAKLTIHQRNHQICEQLFSCRFCEESFTNSGRLLKHEKIHRGKIYYSCKYCGKCFEHLRLHHAHEKLHRIDDHIYTKLGGVT